MLGITIDWHRFLLSPIPWWVLFAFIMYVVARIIARLEGRDDA